MRFAKYAALPVYLRIECEVFCLSSFLMLTQSLWINLPIAFQPYEMME